MAGHKRRSLLARRRRHDDEGEEDGSNAGDVLEYASTAGSLTTDAEEDGDVSNPSVDEDLAQSAAPSPVITKHPEGQHAHTFKTTADTEAMLHGLKIKDDEDIEDLHYDNVAAVPSGRSAPARQQPIQRSKSQPIEASKQDMGAQPLNPNRKGYFLHDDRTKDHADPAVFRGRGRGSGPPNGRGFGPPGHDTSKQWTHDLHETVNRPEPHPTVNLPSQPAPVLSNAPNRSFSTTTVLGNVPVNVSLPGLESRISATMVKKHYTLLPQHRPPLRRDKPVRISIPDELPRYIFPSTERSFIFIPRAMRPNQQQYKGRGRGSFQGSRRTSMYSYTPSAGMSRRPSIAASNPGSGMHTPTGPQMTYQAAMQKPIVRLPVPASSSFISPTQNNEVFLGDNSAIIHSPPATLPMYQPVPQKAVSVADIESPTMAPQQQSQQPFHQQMPQSMPEQSQPKMPHIPEGAIYAQPFQPYPNMHHQGFYGGSFHPAMMMPSTEQMGYAMDMGGPVMPVQQPQTATSDQQQGQGPIAHESNGMVYYYNPSQQYPPPQMMNMNMNMNMMQAPYFYPSVQNQMYYQ